jgi:glycosyltransferase involved in cell wall biosynthesis
MTKRITLICSLLLLSALVVWQFTSRPSPKKHHPVTPTSEKPFVILIASYNNAEVVQKNLASVYTQNYDNYRVIYIDDSSSDATFERAEKEIARWEGASRTILIHNKKNLGALANIYNAVHSCADNEIVVILDGDDFFAHENVLTTLNNNYADSGVWLTYGSYLDYPSYQQGPAASKAIPALVTEKNAFRKHPWVSSHLRTFYAGLFKAIKIEDLFFRGRFFPMGCDVAIMLPMLEMAGHKARFIDEVLYLYNRANPINDHKVNFKLQKQCANEVRSKPVYERLAQLPTLPYGQREKADLLVFSYHRPMQLYALLESVEKNVRGLNQTTVLYRADTLEYKNGYATVKERFPTVHFVEQKNAPEDFRDLTLQIVFDSSPTPSEHILFAVDDMIVKHPVDLTSCVHALKASKAYGFYLCHSDQLDTCYMLNRHQGVPPHTHLSGIATNSPIFAWQFSAGADDWAYPNSLDMVLFNKETIKKDFYKIEFTSPTSLESKWNLRAKKRGVGLFYAEAKCLNIPANLVTTNLEQDEVHRFLSSYTTNELLQKFEEGLKIDIKPLSELDNRSRHVAADFAFIQRGD